MYFYNSLNENCKNAFKTIITIYYQDVYISLSKNIVHRLKDKSLFILLRRVQFYLLNYFSKHTYIDIYFNEKKKI